MSSLPRYNDLGNMPNILVYGDNAKPVLTAPYKPYHIAIAAAEKHGGRLVALSNIRYGLHFLNDDDEQVLIKLLS